MTAVVDGAQVRPRSGGIEENRPVIVGRRNPDIDLHLLHRDDGTARPAVPHIVHAGHSCHGVDRAPRVGCTADDDDRTDQRFEAPHVTRSSEQINRGATPRNRREHLLSDVRGAPERQAAGFDVESRRGRPQPFVECLLCNLLQPAVVERQLQVGEGRDPELLQEAQRFATRYDIELQQPPVEQGQARPRRDDGQIVSAERDFMESCLHARTEARLGTEPFSSGPALESRRFRRRHSRESGGGAAQVLALGMGSADVRKISERLKRRGKQRWRPHPLARPLTGTASCGADLRTIGSFAVAHAAMPPSRTSARKPRRIRRAAALSATSSSGSESNRMMSRSRGRVAGSRSPAAMRMAPGSEMELCSKGYLSLTSTMSGGGPVATAPLSVSCSHRARSSSAIRGITIPGIVPSSCAECQLRAGGQIQRQVGVHVARVDDPTLRAAAARHTPEEHRPAIA